MAKVNNTEIYPFDDSISPNDYVLGTDGDPTKGLATKNFQISGLINLINAVNGNSSMAFKFQDGSNLATTFLTPGHFFSEFNKITPSTLTKLHLNNKNTQGTIVNNLISLLLNSNLFVLKLVNVADVTNVIYLNTSATILNSGYFSFDVNRFNNLSNGVLVNKDTYIFQFELLNKTVLDKIIQIGEITILNTPNRIKIDTPIDGIWTINGIKHTVLVDTEISITNASAGMFRKDIIVATNLGRYLLIQGVESASNPFSPTIPNNTLLVTEVLVFENRVNETTPPIVGDIYIEKIEKAQVDCVDTGIIDYTFINNRAVVSFTGSVTTLRSANLVVETSYLHKKYTFKNNQTIPITFKHLSGTGNRKFFFPNKADFIMRPNEVFEFLDFGVVLQFVGRAKFDYNDLDNLPNLSLFQLISEKGMADGYVGLNGLTKIGSIYLDIINDLTTGGATFLLSAEQGVVLKGLVDSKEATLNKTDVITGNETSSILYSSIKGIVVWVKNGFIGVLPAKATAPVDADLLVIGDSADSFKTKTISLTQLKVSLLTYFQGFFSIPQITITTSISITTLTTGSSLSQHGRNVIIDNGVNAINLTTDITSEANFVSSYLKHGASAITFSAGANTTLIRVDGTEVLNGAVGSTATLSRVNNVFYLRISNV